MKVGWGSGVSSFIKAVNYNRASKQKGKKKEKETKEKKRKIQEKKNHLLYGSIEWKNVLVFANF